MTSSLSRRRFLQSAAAAGSAAALFPWLSKTAKAQAAPIPKLLLFYTPHGTVWNQWRPTGGETNFTMSPILEPLTPHRDKIVIVDGVAMRTGTSYYIPHTYTMPVLWTGSPIDTASTQFTRTDHNQSFGWNTGTSVDQMIASRIGGDYSHPTIELGYGCGGLHPATRMIYAGAGQPKSPIDDPTRAFATLFGMPNPDAAVARRRASVLDAVRGDSTSRRGRLSATDRARLESHATSLADLERSLVPSALLCDRPDEPMGVTAETAIDHQSRLAAAALGCGLTRVASIQVRIADNDGSLYPWVGISSGGHHSMSHDSGATAQSTLAGLYRWYAQRFAYLLNQLATTPDGEGRTLLDNTLVIWGSELGQAWNHKIDNVPFIFAGGAAGRMRGGRYMDVRTVGGTWNNRVLVSAAHAMGLTDVQRYGTLDDGNGPLPGLLTG